MVARLAIFVLCLFVGCFLIGLAYVMWTDPTVADDKAVGWAACSLFFAPCFLLGAWEQVFPPKR